MADTDYLEIYQDYTAEELDAAIASMKAMLEEGENYVSQNSGDGKSYMVDLADLRKRLSSAIRARNKRRNPGGGNGSFVYDFR